MSDLTKKMTVDRQLCFAVYAAGHAFSRFYRSLLAAFDMTYPQYLVMLVLWERDNLTVGDIGAQLSLDSGTLTPLLRRLETSGLLTRFRDSADERQVRIRLTSAGAEMQAKAMAAVLPALETIEHQSDHAAELRDELYKLRHVLTEATKGISQA